MARRTTSPPTKQMAELTVDQMRIGIACINKRIAELEAFDPTKVNERWAPEVSALQTSIDETLTRVFGHNTVEYDRYDSAARLDNGPLIMGGGPTAPREVQQYLYDGKARSLALLRQAVRGLEEDVAEREALAEPSDLPYAVAREIAPQRPASEPSIDKVFVAHGHGGGEHAVAGFLRKLGLEAVILHERANEGRTIIEKFEARSDVGFAVVLITPDDVGGLKDGPQRPRARQNVILELGYFVGRLGRKKVCPLIEGDVELPSDVLGVVWVTLDAHEGWHMKLAKELRAAGFDIDLNKI
jgi:predicted nucleotide-binding protein